MRVCDESCTKAVAPVDPELVERIRREVTFAKERRMVVARIDLADAEALLASLTGEPNG